MASETKAHAYILKSLAKSSLPCFLHRCTNKVDFLSIKTAKDFKASGLAHVAWFWHKRSQGTKIPEVKQSQFSLQLQGFIQ